MSAHHVLALLAAELPDPGRLPTLGYASGFGAFAFGVVGRLRRLPRRRVTEMAADGAFVGFGVGFACWLVAVATDVL